LNTLSTKVDRPAEREHRLADVHETPRVVVVAAFDRMGRSVRSVPR